MGWLKRRFGQEKPENPQQAIQGRGGGGGGGGAPAQAVPVERMGLHGEYDQSGLAKRVALAFDSTPELKDVDSVYVAQTGSTVVLKGTAPSQAILDKLEAVARGIPGAQAVDSSQVTLK